MGNRESGTSYSTGPVSKDLLSHQKATLKLEQEHEATLKDKEYSNSKEILNLNQIHEKALKDKDLGLIGKCFGGKELVSLNISGLLIVFLIFFGTVLSWLVYCPGKIDDVLKIWGIITPLITLTLGYIFGSNDK